MAHCFQLTKIGDTEPSAINDIDSAMAIHFNIPEDNKYYVHNWFNVEGWALASGQTFDQIIELFTKDEFDENTAERLPVVQWLKDNYTVISFRS